MRQLASLKKGNSPVPVNFPERSNGRARDNAGERGEAKKRQGERTDIPGNLPECSNGEARDKAGARLGVSGSNFAILHFDRLSGCATASTTGCSPPRPTASTTGCSPRWIANLCRRTTNTSKTATSHCTCWIAAGDNGMTDEAVLYLPAETRMDKGFGVCDNGADNGIAGNGVVIGVALYCPCKRIKP